MLAAIAAAGTEGVIGQDLDGRITVWSPGAELLYGWTASEMIGQPIFRAIPADSEGEWRFLLNRVARSERVQELRTRRLTKDGRKLEVSVTVAPLRGAGGEIIGAATIERDITRRWRTDAILDGQRRMLEVLSQSGELKDALGHLLDATDELLSRGMRVCVMQYEPERHRLVPCASRLPSALERALADGIHIAPGAHPSGEAMFTGQAVSEADIAAAEGWNGLRDVALGSGLKACCSTPIRSPGGKVIGTLDLYAPQVGDPETDDLEVADDIAQAAGLALERFETVQGLKTGRQVLLALNEINGLIARELDAARIYERVTEEATHLLKAQAGAFLYNDSARGELRIDVLAGPMRERFEQLEIPRNTPLFNQTLMHGAIQRFDDVARDPRFGKTKALEGLLKGPVPIHSLMSAPVATRTGELIGMLLFGHESRRCFTRGHEDILRGVAQQTALAVETARLYQQASERADALSEADRRKNEFLAMLGHELRNPLSALAAGLSLIQDDLPAGDSTREAVEILNRQAAHMRRLVDDLLDVGRITRGKIDLERDVQDLRERLRTAALSARTLAGEYEQEIQLELPEAPVFVEVDAVRIEQVVGNLLHNAMRFSERGATIDLALETRSGDALILVRDGGRGIPPDQLSAIFDVFVQAERPDGPHPSGGLGLGLTLVRKLAELHGGSVVARSEGVGKGSEFEVRLPLFTGATGSDQPPAAPPSAPAASPEFTLPAPAIDDPDLTPYAPLPTIPLPERAPAEPAAATPKPIVAPKPSPKRKRTEKPPPRVPIAQVPLHDRPEGPTAVLRILLAEDLEDTGRALKLLLERWGHKVTHVASGARCLEEARQRRPDVALLDINLPDIDGWALARDLIRVPGLREIRLAALSGRGQRADREASRVAGFEQHFVKPVDPRLLHSWLREVAAEIAV
ncbi:MAG: GAF domain-containing protein [Planctomycetota bacterium]|nr:GAF domain-containing protein [Planctomycetota bacterium]